MTMTQKCSYTYVLCISIYYLYYQKNFNQKQEIVHVKGHHCNPAKEKINLIYLAFRNKNQ